MRALHTQGGVDKPAPCRRKKGGALVRRLLLFPIVAAVMAAMVVISTVPALGNCLEWLAGFEHE
jgi:hypothetical protein